jgi:hypothetical protein
VVVVFLVPDLLFPGAFGVLVEEQQVGLCGSAAIGIVRRLRQTLGEDRLQRTAHQLQLEHNALQRSGEPPLAFERLLDEEVRTPPAEPVFSRDASASVDDALQERLQEQLRTGLLVLEALDP